MWSLCKCDYFNKPLVGAKCWYIIIDYVRHVSLVHHGFQTTVTVKRNDQRSFKYWYALIFMFYQFWRKLKFLIIKSFFSKGDQICRKLPIWLHLLKRFFLGNFIFRAVNNSLLIQILPSSEYNLPLAITLERMQQNRTSCSTCISDIWKILNLLR